MKKFLYALAFVFLFAPWTTQAYSTLNQTPTGIVTFIKASETGTHNVPMWLFPTSSAVQSITLSVRTQDSGDGGSYEIDIFSASSVSEDLTHKATCTGNVPSGADFSNVEFVCDTAFYMTTSDWIGFVNKFENRISLQWQIADDGNPPTFGADVWISIQNVEDWSYSGSNSNTSTDGYMYAIGEPDYFISSNILLYDENNDIIDPSCTSNSNVQYQSCSNETIYTGFILESEYLSQNAEYQIEFYVLDLDGNISEPVQFYSGVFFDTTSVGEYTDAFDFPIQNATSSVNIKICINDRYSSAYAYWGQEMVGRCSNIIYGNGVSTSTLNSYITGIPDLEKDGVTTFFELDCDEIGILDVKKGVQCALIWAFKPNASSLEKFGQTKNLILSVYPIGYASIIVSDLRDTFSTTTNAFDRDIDVKKFFGQTGGTTTISVSNLTSEMGMVQPIIDYFDTVLWIIFVCWLVYWGLTRKL